MKDLRENAPLYAIECDEVSKVVRKLGVLLLGGKESNAYRDVSLRKKSIAIFIVNYIESLELVVIKLLNVII